MRGRSDSQGKLFFAIDVESRIRPDHPLRSIKQTVDEILKDMSQSSFRWQRTVPTDRPSVPPERFQATQSGSELSRAKTLECDSPKQNRPKPAKPIGQIVAADTFTSGLQARTFLWIMTYVKQNFLDDASNTVAIDATGLLIRTLVHNLMILANAT